MKKNVIPILEILLIYAIFTVLFSTRSVAAVRSLPTTEVLIINSFHHGHFWENDLVQRITEELESTETGFQIRLHCEYLDYERHPSGSLDTELISLLSQKYKAIPLKIILVTDNDALDFMFAYGDRLFPKVPVVFCGIADPPVQLAEHRTQYTGILENFSIYRILEAIPRVHPNARHLVVICGDTTSARTALRQSASELSAVQPDLSIQTLIGLPLTELQNALQELPKETVILNFGYYRTTDGEVLSMKESLHMLRSWTSLPMYSPWSGQLGKGVLAGQCEFNAFHAIHAARMTLSILKGIPPKDIPLLYEPAPYLIFDYPMLKQYGIDENTLPADAIVMNRPLSFYEQHRSLLLPVTAIIMVLFGVILLLMYLLRIKQRSESLLKQEKVIMTQTHELERRSQLARRMEAIGRMAGGITHDVNNILGGIAACAQLALPEISRDNPAHEDVSRILDATVRGRELMQQIRMTDSTKTLDTPNEFPLVATLIRECAERLQPQVPAHIILRVSDTCPGVRIHAVGSEVHQMLLNLCLNAIQAMPEQGELVLTASLATASASLQQNLSEETHVRLDVSDTGKGIPPELMEFIFDPFFTTRQDIGGSGLGLAQVLSLVQRNKGALRVANRPDGGTCFSLFFLLAVAPPPTTVKPISSKRP